jgi:alkylhydroperoxidase family enzyme
VAKVLADPQGSSVRAPVKAMLAFIEKMVRDPDKLSADDAAKVRAAGADDEALRTAIYICTGFSTITRLADTFEFDIPPDKGFRAAAKMLLSRGYGKLT